MIFESNQIRFTYKPGMPTFYPIHHYQGYGNGLNATTGSIFSVTVPGVLHNLSGPSIVYPEEWFKEEEYWVDGEWVEYSKWLTLTTKLHRVFYELG